MLLLLTGALLVVLVLSGWRVRSAEWYRLPLAISFIMCLVCAMMYFIPTPSDDIDPCRVTLPLRAVRVRDEATGIRGSFFLGCGTVSGGGSKKYFWWYEMRQDGSAAYCQNPCGRTKLFEDGRREVVWIKYRKEFDWWHGSRFSPRPWRDIELHVPEGSILEAWDVQ